MSDRPMAILSKLATGVPGLDEILGGGLPEYSFNLIAGEPGSGKTTLAHQLVFANATDECPVIYFTVIGEPAIKMLRYLQQMSFFDPAKVGSAIHFIDLSAEVLQQDLGKVLDKIKQHVKDLAPAIVVVDSFRTMARSSGSQNPEGMDLTAFLAQLGLYLASWQATTLLIGEYLETEARDNPILTIVDGLFWLTQNRERGSSTRRLQIAKLRGQAAMPGLHTFRIDASGLHVFPRLRERPSGAGRIQAAQRIRSGIPGMDELLGGGIPIGDSLLVAGPSGTGKTCFCTQFAAAASATERVVLAVFEEHPEDYLQRGKEIGCDLDRLVHQGLLKVISLRRLDLSVDEALQAVNTAVKEVDAKRLVIDSLTGLEVSLAPAFREDFRESLHRMMGALTGAGVTIVMTVEVTESWHELRFSPHTVSFLTENIILLRYVELAGALKKVLAVVKMRRSAHDKRLYEFEITDKGIVLKAPLTQYQGILSGEPRVREILLRSAYPGLTGDESRVLEAHLEGGDLTPEAIAAATELEGAKLAHALDRLVALNYLIKVIKDGKSLYRPLARALGR